MTSVIFNDPSGSDYLYKFSGVQLNAPSGETLALGANAKTADNSNAIVTVGESYIRIPQGISNERPDISNSYIGMMRYLTTENLLEYFNGQTNQWVPISLPNPNLNSITPQYINYDASGTSETNTNTYTLTGSNFNNAPGGISVEVIGNNGTGTILNPDSNSASSETSATFTFDPSGTEQLIGISNELPFAVKLTNTNSGFSSTLNNAIIATNAGPEFTQPSVFTPSSFQTFAVQDPCANFIVGGIDLSTPVHYPLDFSFVSGTAGGFNTGGVSDISKNGPLSDSSNSTVKVPTGNRLSATATSYNFKMRVRDASHATSDANYTLTLANPTITSIDPSLVFINDLPIDISVNGNYFIRDSHVVLYNQSTGISAEFSDITYNSTTSLTINDLSFNAGVGVYDICVNNFNSPYQFFTNKLTIAYNIMNLTINQTINSGTYTDGGKTYNWYEWGPNSNTTNSNTYSSAITINSISNNPDPQFNKIDFLIIAGGGSGGGGWQGGGGGAGGLISSVGQSGGPSTAVSPFDATGNAGNSYTVIVGGGGIPSLYNDGGSNRRSANGGDSSLFSNTAIGGGGGAGEQNLGNPALSYGPLVGGSGGGGSHGPSTGVGPAGGTANQGNSGGSGFTGNPYVGGGGGGAGGVGNNATSGGIPGNGGIGLQININGTATYYAGGGGGTNRTASSNPQSTGGLGGGGNGLYTLGGTGDSGTVRTGGGGGAVGASGGGSNGQTSGTGGSGVVFIRYRIA